MKVIFLITVMKSRGEAYLALKAARDIEAKGGSCRFVAMPEVSTFLEKHGFKPLALTLNKEENRRSIAELIGTFCPDGFVYVSYRNLHLGIGIGKVFDPEWIKVPQATFDPENYERKLKKVDSGPLINRAYRLPRIPKDMKVISTDFKEKAIAPENTFFYKLKIAAYDKQELRRRYAWPKDEPVVVFPISRWIYDNTVYFNSSYYREILPNLIMHYFSVLKKPLTVLTIGTKELFAGAKWGDVKVVHEQDLAVEEYEQRLAAADLLLTDNGMSGSIEIATQVGTPVLVLKNSVKASLSQGQLKTEAPFAISGYVQELMQLMLKENPKSIFPFAIYPLGWWSIVEHLFKDNPLHRTFCEAELFDEKTVQELFNKLLWDKEFREKMLVLQQEYTQKQKNLTTFAEVAELIFK